MPPIAINFSSLNLFLFISIISLRYDDPSWTNYTGSILWMVLVSTSATLMGLLLSSTVSTTEKVMSIVPISLIPQIMLGGVIAKITSPLVEYFSYLTIARWGTEGMTIIQEKVYSANMINSSNQTTDGLELLKMNFYKDYDTIFGKLAGTINLDIIALLTLSILFYFFIFYSLKKKDAINS